MKNSKKKIIEAKNRKVHKNEYFPNLNRLKLKKGKGKNEWKIWKEKKGKTIIEIAK